MNQSMDRSMAAQGLTGSGFAAEERRTGLIQLGAQETENQFNRLKDLYDVGFNASTAGANAITGNATNLANNQIAQGQANAQGIMGVAGANANMVNGIANSLNSSLGAYLGNQQWQQFASSLNNRNTRTSAKDPVFDSVDTGGSYTYLRPGS